MGWRGPIKEGAQATMNIFGSPPPNWSREERRHSTS
jgi:hypothetical protein